MEINNKRAIFKLNLLVTLNILILSILILFTLIQINAIKITGFSVLDSYDQFRVYILNNYQGEDVSFVVPINNLGEKQILKVTAEIDILDSNNTKVLSLITDAVSVQPNETKELKGVWFNSSHSGDYQARVLIILDNETYSFSRIFKIEEKVITFESIVINEFKLGEIANFSILVKNHLDNILNNVSAGILILDESGSIINEVISEKENLNSKETKGLKVKWDTRNIKSGKYNAKLIVNYNEEFIDRDIVLDIREDSIEVIGVGYSIATNPSKDNYSVYVILFLVVILVLINIIWIVLYNKKSKVKTQ